MAKILIADDDAALRDICERALLGDGHHVTVVVDGGEALNQITANLNPDLLVADVDMPVLDGLALAEKVSALHPTLNILLISGMPERLQAASQLKSTKISTLAKPFTLDALRSAVTKICG